MDMVYTVLIVILPALNANSTPPCDDEEKDHIWQDSDHDIAESLIQGHLHHMLLCEENNPTIC
jgi:hypothetical protein